MALYMSRLIFCDLNESLLKDNKISKVCHVKLNLKTLLFRYILNFNEDRLYLFKS